MNLQIMKERLKNRFIDVYGKNEGITKTEIIKVATGKTNNEIATMNKYAQMELWRKIKYCFKMLRDDQFFVVCEFFNDAYVWFQLNDRAELNNFKNKLNAIKKGIDRTQQTAERFLKNS